MKTTMKLFVLVFIAVTFGLTSCTKEGPEGPAGAIGSQGIQGEQGVAGANGSNGVDAVINPIIFKVVGSGYAVKDLDGGSTIETDIWDAIAYDSTDSFNATTKRYVIPETGYYFLQSTIDQSNGVTNAFFGIYFNIDRLSRQNQTIDGDDLKISVSGVYYLTEGQEVWVNLRNYSSGENVRIDGYGSWFEGYKIG